MKVNCASDGKKGNNSVAVNVFWAMELSPIIQLTGWNKKGG